MPRKTNWARYGGYSESYVHKFFELATEWDIGYSNYIEEFMKKKET
jgi:hypothetical protein